ncbi:MAG: hypothetical protein PHE50_00080 [Dehalococcoidales bacterium]|nr:hypothetical protein [Dehalococcoidales bacterium]
MTVERYNVNVNFIHSPKDGDWVKYEDYKKLEARIAEMEKQKLWLEMTIEKLTKEVEYSRLGKSTSNDT